MRPTPTRAVILLLMCALTACDSGDNAAPERLDTLAPTDTLPVTTSTAATATSTAGTESVATAPTDAIELSADGPWKLVDSAPGVTTPGLVYQLMPGLWVYLPLVEDIPHGITWVLNEDDRPVIEAYLMAELTYYRSITSDPMDLTNPDWAKYYTDAGSVYFSDLQSRRDQGQVADLASGVVLRPAVLGEARSDDKAVVYDCILDGGVFRLPSGALAPGSTPGVAEYGEGAEMELHQGAWRVKLVGTQEDAC